LSTAAGTIAVMLACLGLYGTVSYRVTLRSTEIGVRLALGSSRNAVMRMVFTEAIGLVVAGVAIGIPATVLLARYVDTRLFRVHAGDPVVWASGPLLLIVVASIAGFVPSRRASRLDPMVALREE